MRPLTNAEIAARKLETDRRYGTVSVGTGLGSVASAYTFGHYQVMWWGQSAQVRDTAANNEVVYSGTTEECWTWAKARAS